MLSIVLAYGSFYTAGHFGMSGVLASAASGIMLSWQLAQTQEEKTFRSYLDGFWNVVEPSILSLIFLVIGIEAVKYLSFHHIWFIIIIFILSLIARLIVLTLILKIFPHWRKKFLFKEISLITWSGIKGTMSAALLLGLAAQSSERADTILSLTFGVIILSLIIQSLFIYPLSKRLL